MRQISASPGRRVRAMIVPGKRGAKATCRVAAFGGEVGDEKAAAGQAAAQAGEQAAAGVGVHPHAVGHPGHRRGLAVDGLARSEIDADRLHRRAGDFVAHGLQVSAVGRISESLVTR